VVFSISISGTGDKSFVAHEVNSNIRAGLHIIEQKIRSSNGLNTEASTFGSDPGVLSLSMASTTQNPTVFSLDSNNGVLQISEGGVSTTTITSGEVKVTNLVFTDLTASSTRENIRIEITVEYNNLSNDIQYDYSRSIQTAVNLRQ